MSTLIEQLSAEMRETREALRASEFRADQAEYEIFTRAKYSTQDKKDMLKSGHAMANPNGDPSYPIKDQEDLQKAIHAVGRGSADHNDIRQHIIKRAKALGLTSLLPDNWDLTDGSLKPDATQSNSGGEPDETREDNADADTKECPTCGGDGKIMAGHRKCPDCAGSGKVASDFEAKSGDLALAVATWINETTREATFNVMHEPSYRDAPEDAEDRVNAKREQQLLSEIMALDDETREEMIEAAPEPDEIRAAIASYGDIETAVENALATTYGKSGDYCDIWVCDSGDTGNGEERWSVFQSYVDPPGQGAYKVTFNCADDGSITFTSNPVAVARVTTYEPVPDAPVPDLMAARSADMLKLEREAEQDAEIRNKVSETPKRGK